MVSKKTQLAPHPNSTLNSSTANETYWHLLNQQQIQAMAHFFLSYSNQAIFLSQKTLNTTINVLSKHESQENHELEVLFLKAVLAHCEEHQMIPQQYLNELQAQFKSSKD